MFLGMLVLVLYYLAGLEIFEASFMSDKEEIDLVTFFLVYPINAYSASYLGLCKKLVTRVFGAILKKLVLSCSDGIIACLISFSL